MKRADAESSFDADRVAGFLKALETKAAGDLDGRMPVSASHDALDAIAFGVDILAEELVWANARAREQETRAAELRSAAAAAQARISAMLHAVPDLMFVIHRDGTYLDYHASNPGLLFAPPQEFLGRNVREILPRAIAEPIVEALERACDGKDPVVSEYELPVGGEPRVYEARIVRMSTDRALSIVRDITDARRSSDRIRDLAQRLIVRQEMERQRIGRELHDDIGQRLALMNIEIDRMTGEVNRDTLRGGLQTLSWQVAETAVAVRDLLYELHPLKVQILGGVAAIESLCERPRHRDLHVAFTRGALPSSVDENTWMHLYRIVQEGLNNVARHSSAHEAQVRLTFDAGVLTLEIADTGVGFDPTQRSSGLGLVSIEERVAALKGQLDVDAAPARGTRIRVRIPVVSSALG